MLFRSVSFFVRKNCISHNLFLHSPFARLQFHMTSPAPRSVDCRRYVFVNVLPPFCLFPSPDDFILPRHYFYVMRPHTNTFIYLLISSYHSLYLHLSLIKQIMSLVFFSFCLYEYICPKISQKIFKKFFIHKKSTRNGCLKGRIYNS